MAVFRVEKTRDFTIMSNCHLEDKNLSLKSKGLLSMMLSLPENWNYTSRGLAAICKEGVDSIGGALRELEGAGYIVRNRFRDAKGKITDTEYVIYERPQKPDANTPSTGEPGTGHPHTDFPYMDNSDAAEPCTEITAQLNTKGINGLSKSTPDKSNTYGSSIHPSIHSAPEAPGRPDWMDRMDEMEKYRELIMEKIEYDIMAERYGSERLDEVVEFMLEAVVSKRAYIRIAGEDYPRDVVKSRMLKLSPSHLEYVFDCLDKNTTKIRNIRAYTLTALYNAPATIDSYYRAEVRHDLYSGSEN